MVLTNCVCTDIYVSGLLLIDVLFLSYPSPYFIAFCPQPKAIMMILLCWCLSREKKRYFGRFDDDRWGDLYGKRAGSMRNARNWSLERGEKDVLWLRPS